MNMSKNAKPNKIKSSFPPYTSTIQFNSISNSNKINNKTKLLSNETNKPKSNISPFNNRYSSEMIIDDEDEEEVDEFVFAKTKVDSMISGIDEFVFPESVMSGIDGFVFPKSEEEDEDVITECVLPERKSNGLVLSVDKSNDINNFNSIIKTINERVKEIRKKANSTEVKNFYNSGNIRKINSTSNTNFISNVNSILERHVPVAQNNSIISVIVDTKLIETNKITDFSQEFCKMIRNSIKNIKSVNNFFTPYDSIYIDDPNLIDYYFKDLVMIKSKQKRKLTGKKVLGENYYMPPIPSEMLEKCKKRHENFDVNFHYHSYPNKDTSFGYGFKVVCEKFKINHYYKVSSRDKMPSAYLREYLSQKILKLLYPHKNKWIDLLNVLNYKISF